MSVTTLQHCSHVTEIEQGRDYAYCYNLTAWEVYGVPLCKEHMSDTDYRRAA